MILKRQESEIEEQFMSILIEKIPDKLTHSVSARRRLFKEEEKE